MGVVVVFIYLFFIFFIFIRYCVLMRGVARCNDPKEACLQVLRLYDSSSVEWQLGKTRVRNTVSLLLHYV